MNEAAPIVEPSEVEKLLGSLRAWANAAETQMAQVQGELMVTRQYIERIEKLGIIGRADLESRLEKLTKKGLSPTAFRTAVRQHTDLVLRQYEVPEVPKDA